MIRLKLILRNIFQKPLRSVAMIIALAAATFAALYCVSGLHMAKTQIFSFFTASFGNADMMVTNTSGDALEFADGELPDKYDYLEISMTNHSFNVRNKKYYNYIDQIKTNIIGVDEDKFKSFNMINEDCDTKNGVSITAALARVLEKQEGDEIILYGRDKKEYSVKISKILQNKKFLLNNTYCIITTPEFANQLACRDGGYTMLYIDTEGGNTDELRDSIIAAHPSYTAFGLTGDVVEASVGSMTSVYYLVFAITVLMVGFIIVSMSRSVVNERMAVVGMLRSIGGSIKNTSIILFAESAVYGLFGGILGSILYLVFRDAFSMSMFEAAGMENVEQSDGINFFSVSLVIIGVMVLQCICFASAILKGAKTSIRDIIFGTKDTSYVPSKVLYIAGGAMLLVGVVVFAAFDGFVTAVIAAFLSVIGSVLLYPLIVRLLSNLAVGIFEKKNMPIAKLAAREAGSKKSSIASAQLIFSAVSLVMAVIMLAVSVYKMFNYDGLNCDVIYSSLSSSGEKYDYISEIDGVVHAEKIYMASMKYDQMALINGVPSNLSIVSNENYQLFNMGIKDLPDTIGENEAVFDKSLAKRQGLKVGDTVEITVKQDSYMPKTLNLKISSLSNTAMFDSSCTAIIINPETYRSVFYDYPMEILIKTEPGKANEIKTLLMDTKSETDAVIQTIEEYRMETVSNNSSITSILYSLMVLGIVLAVLGTSSNMLISFEQSKRKYAVLYSVAMSKEKLKKVILLETVFMSAVSITIASVMGVYFLEIISEALDSLMMSVPLFINVFYIILFAVLIMLLVTTTCIKPTRSLSKMMISEEIKISTD